ncbi:MAG: helix-turn-helix domain-containing protein [Eubacterium sp.]
MIGENIATLRKINKLSQEEFAEKIGVTRQSISKWEKGDSVPDLESCVLIAKCFNVSIDDLVNYSEETNGLPIPPKGKHIFGLVTVGDKGQIVIPKKARDIFDIKQGDNLLVLGDEAQGIALVKEKSLIELLNNRG